jgi:hypothetical protein
VPVRCVRVLPSALLGVKPRSTNGFLIRFSCVATDEAHPAEAFFSTSLLEQAAGDAMTLSGLFSLCGLVLLLLAAVSLRFGIRTLGQSEAVHRWQINAATGDPGPTNTFSGQTPAIGVVESTGRSAEPVPEPEPEPESEPEPEPEPHPQSETHDGLRPR